MKQQNKTTIIQYSIFGLFSLATIAAGIPKIILADAPVQLLGGIGYPAIAIQLLGLGWILSGIMVWIKQFRSFAALLASHIFAGIIATHIATGLPFSLVHILYGALPLAVLIVDNFFNKVSPELKEDFATLGDEK